MHDLILADYEKYKGAFEREFPNAVIKDVSNENQEKFTVDLDDCYEDSYYKFLIKSSLSEFSCGILIKAAGKEKGRKSLKDLVGEIKREHLRF